MITLGVDTATPTGGVALVHKTDGLIGEIRLKTRKTHSEQIISGINFLLSASGTGIDEIDFFTIAIGPGSFTGLRVGLSTVKGLSFVTGKPVVAASTLEAYARSFPAVNGLICPLLDARKKEVYAGVFKWTEEGLIRVIKETVISIEGLLDLIKEDTLFAGNGVVLYRGKIVECLGKKAHFPPMHLNAPIPSALCEIGFKKAERGAFSDPISISPVYLRKSEAEIKAERTVNPQ